MQIELLEVQLIGKITVSEEEKTVLQMIDETLEEADSSDLFFVVSLSTKFPYAEMKKDEVVNTLSIATKYNPGVHEVRDMQRLAELISQALNIPLYTYNQDTNVDHLQEFIIQNGKTELLYCFTDDQILKSLKIIDLARTHCSSLPVIPYIEPTEDDFLELEYEKEMWSSLVKNTSDEDDEYINR